MALLGPVSRKKILDLGCGDGALAGVIAKAGGQVVGVDPNEVGLALARKQFLKHRLEGEFYPATDHLPEGYFDLIICAEVIEHVPAPDKTLQEIKRLLKPEGIAVISTPIRLAEQVLDREHVTEYFPSEFQELCGKHFEILETRLTLPIALHELLRTRGLAGWLLDKGVKILSAWFNWNYLLKIRGNYRLYAVQFIKLRGKSPD